MSRRTAMNPTWRAAQRAKMHLSWLLKLPALCPCSLSARSSLRRRAATCPTWRAARRPRSTRTRCTRRWWSCPPQKTPRSSTPPSRTGAVLSEGFVLKPQPPVAVTSRCRRPHRRWRLPQRPPSLAAAVAVKLGLQQEPSVSARAEFRRGSRKGETPAKHALVRALGRDTKCITTAVQPMKNHLPRDALNTHC